MHSDLPFITYNAGPLNKEQWKLRLKEEYKILIQYITNLKKEGQQWFHVEPDIDGIKWKGKCWFIYNMSKYEFDLQFEIPATYPQCPFEIELPQLDNLTSKMYRGGKICMDIHFIPYWQSMSPKLGIAHALSMALAPWLAAEIPYLVGTGVISAK